MNENDQKANSVLLHRPGIEPKAGFSHCPLRQSNSMQPEDDQVRFYLVIACSVKATRCNLHIPIRQPASAMAVTAIARSQTGSSKVSAKATTALPGKLHGTSRKDERTSRM